MAEGTRLYGTLTVDTALTGILRADSGVVSVDSGGGYITDAPSDGTTYGRNNGAWTATSSSGVTQAFAIAMAVAL